MNKQLGASSAAVAAGQKRRLLVTYSCGMAAIMRLLEGGARAGLLCSKHPPLPQTTLAPSDGQLGKS
jgi:hypothetical protein